MPPRLSVIGNHPTLMTSTQIHDGIGNYYSEYETPPWIGGGNSQEKCFFRLRIAMGQFLWCNVQFRSVLSGQFLNEVRKNGRDFFSLTLKSSPKKLVHHRTLRGPWLERRGFQKQGELGKSEKSPSNNAANFTHIRVGPCSCH